MGGSCGRAQAIQGLVIVTLSDNRGRGSVSSTMTHGSLWVSPLNTRSTSSVSRWTAVVGGSDMAWQTTIVIHFRVWPMLRGFDLAQCRGAFVQSASFSFLMRAKA